jgi:hypothetical protein
MKRAVAWLLPVALMVCARPAAWAEVFVLANGGRIEGELLNPDEKPRRAYLVQVAEGAQITLELSQVERVVTVPADQRAYEKVRRQYPDTAEGQWALAEWCREHGLSAQRTTHLERVIELDPNHVQAQRGLGHSQINGKWQKREDVMIQNGYVLYQGKWRTKQEIELMESRRKQELDEKAWFQKIERWRAWLGSDRRDAARDAIAAINDPAAVRALAAAMKRDAHTDVRVVFIESLAKIGTSEAVKMLAATALDDANEEVRLTCLDYLQRKPSAEVVAYFVSMLRSKDNTLVNRAAMALGRMKDTSAVGPLIEALVTTHKFKVTTGTGNPNSMSTTFGSGGGGSPGGFSFGGGTQVVTNHISNQPVLDALVALTGQHYGFDKQSWKYWFATQKRGEVLPGRRD